MKTTVVGLFANCDDAGKAANILKNAGFKNLKINCKKSSPRRDLFNDYFGSIFGFKKNQTTEKNSNSLITGIFSKNAEKLEKAKEILREAGAIKTYSFDNMSKFEARSKDFLMKIIALHAKAEMPSIPPIHHHYGHEGLTVTT